MSRSVLLSFLQSQKLLTISSYDTEPWICNVYYGIDDAMNFYFVSSTDTMHSSQILKDPRVAFSTVWYNSENYADRKSVQGKGICKIAEGGNIVTGIRLHNANFPAFKGRLTVDYITSDENNSKIWVIKPSYMKFWNDELYGDDESEEFIL